MLKPSFVVLAAAGLAAILAVAPAAAQKTNLTVYTALEKDNPRADIVLGLAVTSIMSFHKLGLIDLYKPKGSEPLKAAFKDPNGVWTGMDAFLSVACFNTAEAAKGKIAAPTSW